MAYMIGYEGRVVTIDLRPLIATQLGANYINPDLIETVINLYEKYDLVKIRVLSSAGVSGGAVWEDWIVGKVTKELDLDGSYTRNTNIADVNSRTIAKYAGGGVS